MIRSTLQRAASLLGEVHVSYVDDFSAPQGPAVSEQHDELRRLGMTDDEVDVWVALARVAGRMLSLPELHPMERQETATEFHALQNRLLARPGLRTQGWPRTPR